jgi:hypothetical protein
LVLLDDGQIALALANGAQAAIIVASSAVGLVIARIVTGWSRTREISGRQAPAGR